MLSLLSGWLIAPQTFPVRHGDTPDTDTSRGCDNVGVYLGCQSAILFGLYPRMISHLIVNLSDPDSGIFKVSMSLILHASSKPAVVLWRSLILGKSYICCSLLRTSSLLPALGCLVPSLARQAHTAVSSSMERGIHSLAY